MLLCDMECFSFFYLMVLSLRYESRAGMLRQLSLTIGTEQLAVAVNLTAKMH